MSSSTFFDDPKEQSIVKATIVSKYFWAWAKVIMSQIRDPNGRIAYIDLFAGPGRYSDGTRSTPILVLEKAIADDSLRQKLVTIFNDKDEKNASLLQEVIQQIPNIGTLKHNPKVFNNEVGENIVKNFEQMKLMPTLFFVDPWGYKGLSLRLVNSVLKDWGCDCIFFFNYNRINMGLTNPIVEEHMNALFGQTRANQLRDQLDSLAPEERELAIVEELSNALSQGSRYVLPFRFLNSAGNRTSHHLIFVSKHFRGYEIMKGIMAKESTSSTQGVASFEYSPADKRQPLLFDLSRPIDDLENELLCRFAGRTLTMKEIYESHNVGRPYISKNYKDVLMQLESKKKIDTYPSSSERRANTFADTVIVRFPLA